MSKAGHFLLHKDFDEALKVLQEFEKKEDRKNKRSRKSKRRSRSVYS